jgi:TRAP-type C4-dicarboxylate transport system permease small subunit
MSVKEAGPEEIETFRPNGWFERILIIIVAVVIFLMMAITFVDVIGRYVFSLPIPGGFEIIEFLMPLSIFSGLPIITRRRTHIVVSIMDGLFAGHAGKVRQLLVDIGCFVVVAFIAWRLWSQGIGLAEAQKESGFLEWPIAPAAYAISVLSVLTCIVLIVMIIEDIRGFSRREAQTGGTA